MSLYSLLTDTDPDLKSIGEENTPTPEELEALARNPASQLWVLQVILRSSSNCWVKRKLRKYTMWVMFMLGGMAVAQATSALIIKLSLDALQNHQKEIARTVTKEILEEYGLKPHSSLLDDGASQQVATATIKEDRP